MIEVSIGDLQMFYECALRYALGRMSYITGAMSDAIQALPEGTISERSRQVMITDLERYFEDRKSGLIRDMDCDYKEWQALYKFLKQEKESKKPEKEYKILRNAFYCKKCKMLVESKTRHDYQKCKCGNFTDGGLDYIRRGGNTADMEDRCEWKDKV